MSAAPFFIIGSGRSGSTLLRVILASHSRLAIPPETWYVLPLVKELDTSRPLSAEEAERAARIMIGNYRWPDMGIDAGAFRRQVADMSGPFLRDIVEAVYRVHLEREGKARWGDKTPGYIEIVPQLSKMFPGVRFIHLIRDGRDVAKSFQAQRWYGRLLHDNTREWCEAMDFDEHWSRTEFDSSIMRVRYEDLVLDTRKTVQDICAFLGEEFEPQMLSWEDNVNRLVPAREAHIHQKLKRKPDPADVFRWKQDLTVREVFICEAFMRRHLERLGYERLFRGARWLPMFAMFRWSCRNLLPVAQGALKPLRMLRKLSIFQPNRQ